MGFTKKTAKGRLDKYYFLAKGQGYRARSAFKLVQLNKKYNLLDQARVVIDLCAAPGGWLQVAAKYMPVSHVIVGVDLVSIKPIPGVKTIVADITTEKCRSELKRELKSWKADVVLHDGAPNVGRAWLQDAYSQSELVLHSLKLATEFLANGGSFVSKVFRSKEYNSLIWVFNQLFEKVEATKPASSRSVSAEIFVVCRGYKAPTHIDPRLLDPRHVFEDVTLLNDTHTSKFDLMHPEKKIRSREGYEDGTTILFKASTAQEYIYSDEPTTILARFNKIEFPLDTPKPILDLANSKPELREICADLKVLGRREFKLLIKWHKDSRAALGLQGQGKKKASEETLQEVAVVDEDPLEALEKLTKQKGKQEKHEKRKALERKAKQRLRMQLNMDHAEDLAEEFAENETLFSLSNKVSRVLDEGDIVVESEDDLDQDAQKFSLNNESAIETLSDNSEEALWESELEEDYDQRQERLLRKDAVELVKTQREKEKKRSKEQYHAIDPNNSESDEQENIDMEEYNSTSGSDLERGSEAENSVKKKGCKLVTSLLTKEEEKSEEEAKLKLWYSNPVFRELDDEEEAMMSIPESSKKKAQQKLKAEKTSSETFSANNKRAKNSKGDKINKPEPGEIIFVKAEISESDDEPEVDESTKSAVLTPEGMTLAARLAQDRKRAKKDLLDESFNRYAFKDEGPMPRWFTDDESKNNRPQKPVTKEGIALLKAKLRELDARPIKKELEAKGRNRLRTMRKLETMKKKAAIIADSEDLGERAKSEQIQKMLARASKPQKRETKLVIARGSNKGVKGRPRGIKGHYKMVDARMKKEVRAQKRIKAHAKKGSRRK